MMFAAQSDGCGYIFFIARQYDSDGYLSVVRPIGGIERAAAGVETNLSAKMAAESGLQDWWFELRRTGRLRSCVLSHGVQSIFEEVGAGRKRDCGIRRGR